MTKIGKNAHAGRNAIADGRAAVAVQVEAAEAALRGLGQAAQLAIGPGDLAEAEATLKAAQTALALSCRRLRYTLERVAVADPVRLAILAGDQAAVNRAIEAELVEPAGPGEQDDEIGLLLLSVWPAFIHTHGLDGEAAPDTHRGLLSGFDFGGRSLRLRREYDRFAWRCRGSLAQRPSARKLDAERARAAEADAVAAFDAWRSTSGHRAAAYLGRALDPAMSAAVLMEELATKAEAEAVASSGSRRAARRLLARALGDALVADVVVGCW